VPRSERVDDAAAGLAPRARDVAGGTRRAGRGRAHDRAPARGGGPNAEPRRAPRRASSEERTPEVADEPAVEQWCREAAAAESERARTEARVAQLRACEKELAERERQIDSLEQRLQRYRYNPHLAPQDLAQYGVPFEMLAEAAAQGAAIPEQFAVAEAAAARREVAPSGHHANSERKGPGITGA
jgi:hypothetical protein